MQNNSILALPRYLPNVDPVFSQVWSRVINKLPFSVTHHSPDNNSITYDVDINQNVENNVGFIVKLEVTLSWWDQCKNGHNSFFIRSHAYVKKSVLDTDLRKEFYHLTQQDVDAYFPQLKKAYAYYCALFTAYGPLYYFENTTYQAGDVDCWGTKAGEQRKTAEGLLKWKNLSGFNLHFGDKTDEFCVPILGEGKKRELDSARSASFWSDATDNALSVERDQLIHSLELRLPGIMYEFKSFIEELGFEY